MIAEICRVIAIVFFILTITCSFVLAEKCGTPQDELRATFYSRWIGVKAPELGPDAKDRLKGPQVSLEDYKGKRILLYSYHAGDFVHGPSKEEISKIYELLFKAVNIRDEIGPDNFQIVVFTQSPDLYFLPPADQIPEKNKELRRLKDIPVVMAVSPKPYDFLMSPGAIIIDRNGIIQSLYSRPMTETEIRKAATQQDWSGPEKSPPTELSFEGLKLSTPLMKEKHVWSKKVPRIIGMGSANFGHDDSDNLLAVNKDGMLLVFSSDGDIKEEIKVPINIDGKSAAVHGAMLDKDNMAFSILDDQCPNKVTVFDEKGKITWEYPSTGQSKIDAIAFAQVNDDEKTGLLVSLVDNNSNKELHFVSHQGKTIWKINDSISAQNIAFINRQHKMRGLVLRPTYGGGINLFEGSGKYLRTIHNNINLIGIISAAQMDSEGLSQIVAISPHKSHTHFSKTTRYYDIYALAVVMNLDGDVLWKIPLKQRDNFDFSSKPITALDVNSDGIKEWIIRNLNNEIIIMDVSGLTVAKFKPEMKSWSNFAILLRKDKNALFVFGNDEELNTYELEPMKK